MGEVAEYSKSRISFDKLNEKLDDIKTLLEYSIERNEATHIGVIISSFDRVEDIENQLSSSKNGIA